MAKAAESRRKPKITKSELVTGGNRLFTKNELTINSSEWGWSGFAIIRATLMQQAHEYFIDLSGMSAVYRIYSRVPKAES